VQLQIKDNHRNHVQLLFQRFNVSQNIWLRGLVQIIPLS